MTLKPTRKVRLALRILAGLMGMALFGLGWIQYQQWRNIEHSLNEGQSTVVWNFFQFAMEHQKLRTELDHVLANHDTPEAMARLNLRYSILVSRYNLIRDGQSRALVGADPLYPLLLEKLQAFFEQGDHYLDNPLQAPPYNGPYLRDLQQLLADSHEPAQDLLLLSNRAQNRQNTAHLREIRRQAIITGVTSLALALLAVAYGLLALRQMLLTMQRNQELVQLNGEVHHQATHDTLTNLGNRSNFDQRLQQALEQTQHQPIEHALLYIDLDRFKVVNDACGHPAGDQLLREVAVLLGQPVRSSDTIARLGDDEFGILLYQCSQERARQLGEQICQLLDTYRFIHSGQRFHIGASIGLVMVHAQWPTITALMQAADSACRLAKTEGGGRVHLYREGERGVQTHRGDVEVVQRLQSALDENRLQLFWQRIVPMQPRCAPGIKGEVLLRLCENGQCLPPGTFLPVAERFGMAGAIDRWVLNHLIDWLEQHPQALERLDTLAVNLSGQSVGDPAFHCFALSKIENITFAASKLVIEVTETTAITNLQASLGFFEALRGHGVRVALDDFGSGMSSFGYLKHLPADYLKIDGQFMRHLQHDTVDQVTVRAICDVARATDKLTVAEWIDNADVAAMLRDFGVDYGQGYFWHRPAPLDTLLTAEPLSYA
ncbi:MAG TPA: EAL domain-containing protein [Macromonas sp.]|nr:EAL domain-containing protein [Macromonas sp.]